MKKIPFILFFFLLVAFTLFVFRDSTPVRVLQGFVQPLLSNPLQKVTEFRITMQGRDKVLAKLQRENSELKKKLINQEKLKADNVAFRSQYESKNIPSRDLFDADIVGFRGSFEDPEVLIINKGEKHGIIASMAVIFENTLIGKISKITPYYSEVLLTTNQRFKTLGKVVGKDSFGIVSGQGDFIFLDRVAIVEPLKKGDIIITRGDVDINGIGIPADLIIGTVSSVSKKENKPFQTAQISMSLKVGNLTKVFIVKETK